jgi:glycosyltransferase involved in cell wall biosynthesis
MLSWEYPPFVEGGMGRHVAELAPALAADGVDVHVVTPVGEPSIAEIRHQIPEQFASRPDLADQPQATVSVEDGLTVHRVITRHKNSPVDIFRRATEVNRSIERYVENLKREYGHCGLVHTHDWLTGATGRLLQRKWNCCLVSTIHATERGRARGHLTNELQYAIDQAERELIANSGHIIVCSEHMLQELQTFFRVAPAKLHTIPNGVDLTALRHISENDLVRFRNQFAAPEERIVFSIARLVFEKGIHRLVDAIPKILSYCPDVRFVVAGKGPEAGNLRRQAESLGVADRIDFIGFISDVDRNKLFRVADCAVFPSLYEPFGIVALEAMALGCPVVVSDVGGFSEVVTHRRTGITVYADDPASVAWGVTQSLTHPEWTGAQVARAKKWVEDNFTWARIARLTEVVYRQALTTGQK